MATSPFLTALGDLFQTDLVPGIEDRLEKVDRTYREVVSSKEEIKQDEITKDYKVIHTFVTSLAGAIRPAAITGPNMLTGTGSTQMISAHDSYPGVGDIPLPGLESRYITMAKQRGNITLNLNMLRANQLRTVGDYPALVLQKTADMLAHYRAVSWYLDDSAGVVTLDLTGSGATVAVTGNVVTCTGVTATGTVLAAGIGPKRRLQTGMQYDVWKTDESTCYTTRGWAMLTSNVDMYSHASINLYFQSAVDAAEFYTAQGADGGGDFDVNLVPYGALPTRTSDGTNTSILPCGFQWWMRATGTLFGAFGDLDVTTYGSLFKSYIVTVSAGLTETLLNSYIRTFEEATGVELDTIVMTPGARQALLNLANIDTSSGLVRIQRHNEAQNLQLGWEDLGYTYNGKTYRIFTSVYLKAGQVVIMKCNDGNLVRYKPPRVPGTDAMVSGMVPDIEWLGKKFYDSIWMPSTAPGGGRTDGIEAPFDLVVQHAAKEVRGVLLGSVTEA